MGLFGKNEKPPKEQVREWTSKLRKEQFQLDRQIRAIKREEDKVKKSLKDAAKRGDTDVCKVLAKEIIRARKAINRIHTSKAQINSVQMSMNHQLEEMIEDTLEGLDDQDELEEEAQEEIDKVLWELTAGQLGTAPAAVSESLPETEVEGATATTSKTEDFADMQERLEALRS
ncbi:Charged multivesicular body protein 3 like protein [Argiope bruennichi]|uniref:Charged multivesicular body protein 3 like protein n=1 Tax=Argiope bruennichi TaxID=94029 RepID=A0A8T0F751_ARGBR|nr:Charged multivesicular body protein 3 like protein [Argiope bruennichi]